MSEALLSLGSNIGDRKARITEAIRQLAAIDGVSIVAISPLYQTRPVGPVAQDDFINGALRIKTVLSAEALMEHCLEIEASMGRDRSSGLRWGPRIIDIDLILYDSLTLDTEHLILPHPRFRERAFVVVPMADIAPDWQIGSETLHDLATRIDRQGIEPLVEKVRLA
jgi:2-amino-4-hydroxy-6-hydroxymethyldihydropteridine diphosphokinase